MNAALADPMWRGLDMAKAASNQCFTFICSDCDRMHHGASDRIPDGWDLQPGAEGNAPTLHCPDCVDSIAQADIARRNAQSFTLFLEKAECGAFHIALTPENVLMRWLPLAFYLTPTQARTLAAQLNTHAALAENPGAVPKDKGGVA